MVRVVKMKIPLVGAVLVIVAVELVEMRSRHQNYMNIALMLDYDSSFRPDLQILVISKLLTELEHVPAVFNVSSPSVMIQLKYI